MYEIIKLGLPIRKGTNLYPMVNHDTTNIKQIKTIQKDGIEVSRISFTSLDCTYIETVRHITNNGPLPEEIFDNRKACDIYRALIVHLDIKDGDEISLSDLESALKNIRKGDAFIVDANSYIDKWLNKCNGIIDINEYNLNSPYFSIDAMKGIINAGVGILASNIPSYSNPKTKVGFGLDMIAEFYKNIENMILTPLLNLTKVKEKEVILQINPLKIEGCCGLPCNPAIYQGELKNNYLNFLAKQNM